MQKTVLLIGLSSCCCKFRQVVWLKSYAAECNIEGIIQSIEFWGNFPRIF